MRTMRALSVFRAYDVRGIYGQDLTDDIAYRTARAFAESAQLRNVAVGYDMRGSSKPLVENTIRGFIDSGVNVVDIGMCTTPMLGFAIASSTPDIKNPSAPAFDLHSLDGGIMVTASHSPKQYNGLKLLGCRAMQISEMNGMKKIEKIALAGKFEKIGKGIGKGTGKGNGKGKTIVKTKRKTEASRKIGEVNIRKDIIGEIKKEDILPKYLVHLLKFCSSIKNLQIVVDAGNGVGGISAEPLFDALKEQGVKTTKLFFNPDGSFPNHEANPMKAETLAILQQEVMKRKADLGIAFDGDGDRARIIDEKGNAIATDILFAALMSHELPMLRQKNLRRVYYDLRFSRIVPEIIKKAGGNATVMRVGNPFYKEKLMNIGGYAAAELSGHIMYQDNYCLDDGLFAAVKAMSMICETGRKMSEIVAPFSKYYQSEEMNFEVHDAKKAMAELKKEFSGKNFRAKVSYLDGITIEGRQQGRRGESKWFWFNARPSNTEPLLRLRAESEDEKTLQETLARIKMCLEKFEK